MSDEKTVFLAGASGIVGQLLSKLLLQAGYTVYGTTRTEANAEMLAALGVKPVVVDAFDADRMAAAVADAKPAIVMHQLTDLPDGLAADEMEAALVRNARIRDEGTRNLVAAAEKAGVGTVIAQSIAFVYEPGEVPFTEDSPLLNFEDPAYGETSRGVHSLEEQVVNGSFVGVALRNGWFYGPGTGVDEPVDFAPPVHVEAAAHAAFLALKCTESGIYNVAEDNAGLSSEKAKRELGWSPSFRMADAGL